MTRYLNSGDMTAALEALMKLMNHVKQRQTDEQREAVKWDD